MVEAVFSGVIFGLCAVIMLGIGISQRRSKEPVGFYSGEKHLAREQLTDVDAWNKKHGNMWIIYGCIIILTWVVGLFCGDSVYILVPYFLGLIGPVIVMIRVHKKLMKTYLISEKKE